MRIICIILARYGSARLPKKNLILYKKKPLIFWTIKQSLEIKRISKIILSTDSRKIINIGNSFSKKIFINKRIKKFSGSKTKSETVIKYLSKIYNFDQNDYVLLLQPTSPLRKKSDINNIISISLKNRLNTLHSGNIYNIKKKINKKIILYKQNLKKYIHSKRNYSYNGAIYLFKFSYFFKYKTIYEKIPNVFKMKNKNSLDIDTIEDYNKLLNNYDK